MRERWQYWGATVGAGLAGAGACLLLAALDLPGLGALGAVALGFWLTRRVVAGAPPAAAQPRLALHAWSPYDRRRSGRVPFARRFARHFRLRRRRPPAAPAPTGEDALRALLWSARDGSRAGHLPTRWRQRDAR